MSRKVSFPSIILEICGLEVWKCCGHIQCESSGFHIFHAMIAHDCPSANSHWTTILKHAETFVCGKRATWASSTGSSASKRSAKEWSRWRQLWSCWVSDNWNWRMDYDGLMDSSILRTLQRKMRKPTIFTENSRNHKSRTPTSRDPEQYSCSSLFIQACQDPVPAKMDVNEPMGQPQDSFYTVGMLDRVGHVIGRSNSLHRSQIGLQSGYGFIIILPQLIMAMFRSMMSFKHTMDWTDGTGLAVQTSVDKWSTQRYPYECFRAKAWSITKVYRAKDVWCLVMWCNV